MARDKTKKTDSDDTEEEVFEVVPSELDEITHAEMRMLYAESTETLRFVKNLQWRTVGSTLIADGGLIFVAGWVKAGPDLTNKMMAITILLTTAVMFTLVIYQFWMHNEMAKIKSMNAHFSNLYVKTRAVKSRLEGNIHRYTLLVFMCSTVALGAVVVNMALNRIANSL
jgi:hypothetical protein